MEAIGLVADTRLAAELAGSLLAGVLVVELAVDTLPAEALAADSFVVLVAAGYPLQRMKP